MKEIQSIEKAFAILEKFSHRKKEFSVTELSQDLGLPRPTVSRIIGTLAGLGYLKKSSDTKRYTLGLKFLHLASIVQESLVLRDIATPVLHRLRDLLSETVYIDVRDGWERVCIESFQGLEQVRTFVEIGQRSPLHIGADSLMLLTSLADEEIDEYLEKVQLVPYTENTIVDPLVLRVKIREAKEKGYTYSAGEYHPGSACLSAPIRDRAGKIVACIAISFPTSRAVPSYINIYRDSIISAALEISTLNGYEHKEK